MGMDERQVGGRYLRSAVFAMRYGPGGRYALYHAGSGVIVLTDALGAWATRALLGGRGEAEVARAVEARAAGAGERLTHLMDRLGVLGATSAERPRRTMRWRARVVGSLAVGALAGAGVRALRLAPVWALRAVWEAAPYSPIGARTHGQVAPYVAANLRAAGFVGQSDEWCDGMSWAVARAAIRTYFFALLCLVVPQGRLGALLERAVDFRERERVERLMGPGRGAVLALLHSEAFLAAPLLLYLEGKPVTALLDAWSAGAPLATAFDLRASVPFAGLLDSRERMVGRSLLGALGEGKLVAIPFDAAPHAGQLRGGARTVRFLGLDLRRFDGPAWLAARANTPLVFCGTYRAGGKTRLALEEAIYPDMALPLEERVAALTKALYAAAEMFVRTRPEAWMFWTCLHDLLAAQGAENGALVGGAVEGVQKKKEVADAVAGC